MCVCVVKMQRLASQLVKFRARSSPVAQWVKDLASSLQHFWLLLWHRFDPWLGSVHMLQVQGKKKKKKMGARVESPASCAESII